MTGGTVAKTGSLFWVGWVASGAVTSLLQDIIGKRRFLAYESAHWWSSWVTVPLALAILGFCLFSVRRSRSGRTDG